MLILRYGPKTLVKANDASLSLQSLQVVPYNQNLYLPEGQIKTSHSDKKTSGQNNIKRSTSQLQYIH